MPQSRKGAAGAARAERPHSFLGRMVAMKRLLLVAMLVAACLGLLAMPLVAGAEEPLPPDGFFIGLYESAPLSAPIDQNYIWANDDEYNPYGDWYGRLPSSSRGDYLLPYCGWGVYGKGRIQTVPKYLLVSLDLYRAPASGQPLGAPVFSLTPREARAYWLESDVLDPAPWPAFNTHLGAKCYFRWWLYTTSPFAAGDYLLHFRCDFKHPTFDLSLVSVSGHGHGPYKFMPGDKDWALNAWYSFTILP